MVLASIALDSFYYGSLTFTFYNFIRVNILEGLSKQFGTDPRDSYLKIFLRDKFGVAYPFTFLGLL